MVGDDEPTSVLLYVGGRWTPSGMPCTVVVLRGVGAENWEDGLDACCIADTGWNSPPRQIGSARTPRNSVDGWTSETGAVFYFGQPDPADPTHFTISYKSMTPAVEGIIDGWVLENRSVWIEYRDGPGAMQTLDAPQSPEARTR